MAELVPLERLKPIEDLGFPLQPCACWVVDKMSESDQAPSVGYRQCVGSHALGVNVTGDPVPMQSFLKRFEEWLGPTCECCVDVPLVAESGAAVAVEVTSDKRTKQIARHRRPAQSKTFSGGHAERAQSFTKWRVEYAPLVAALPMGAYWFATFDYVCIQGFKQRSVIRACADSSNVVHVAIGQQIPRPVRRIARPICEGVGIDFIQATTACRSQFGGSCTPFFCAELCKESPYRNRLFRSWLALRQQGDFT